MLTAHSASSTTHTVNKKKIMATTFHRIVASKSLLKYIHCRKVEVAFYRLPLYENLLSLVFFL